MDEMVNRFKALGDETRFKIFLLLSEHNICVKSLAKVLDISESAVSQHLKVLRQAGLVKGEKIGYYVHYNAQKDALRQLEHIIGELAKDGGNLEAQKKALHIDDIKGMKVCREKSGSRGGE